MRYTCAELPPLLGVDTAAFGALSQHAGCSGVHGAAPRRPPQEDRGSTYGQACWETQMDLLVAGFSECSCGSPKPDADVGFLVAGRNVPGESSWTKRWREPTWGWWWGYGHWCTALGPSAPSRIFSETSGEVQGRVSVGVNLGQRNI